MSHLIDHTAPTHSERSSRSDVHRGSPPARRHARRLLGVTAAALLSVVGVSCGSDDDEDMDDGVDQTEVTSASGSAVPGQPQEPVNTDTGGSQVTPTQAP